MAEFQLRVNGETRTVDVHPDTPLLYVLMNQLDLRGPRFGCGLGQCGSCSVLADGNEIRSCLTAVSVVGDRAVTTLEGIPAWYATQRGMANTPTMHPVQEAFVDTQAPQCGYCYNGIVIKAAELLNEQIDPSDDDIRRAMNGHLCRCGTYPRILEAIRMASAAMGANR
jgi:aerobic-type carbon monoxide dehydrogenase small subunit (CoxS/CutS family)